MKDMKTTKVQPRSGTAVRAGLARIKTRPDPIHEKIREALGRALAYDNESGIEIVEPKPGAVVCFPIRVTLKWTHPIKTFEAYITDSSAACTHLLQDYFQVDVGAQTATADFSPSKCGSIFEGDYTLAIRAEFPSELHPSATVKRSAECRFTVPPLPTARLNAAPDPSRLNGTTIDLIQGTQTFIRANLVSSSGGSPGVHPPMKLEFVPNPPPAKPAAVPPTTLDQGITVAAPLVIPADKDWAMITFTVADNLLSSTDAVYVVANPVLFGARPVAGGPLADPQSVSIVVHRKP